MGGGVVSSKYMVLFEDPFEVDETIFGEGGDVGLDAGCEGLDCVDVDGGCGVGYFDKENLSEF